MNTHTQAIAVNMQWDRPTAKQTAYVSYLMHSSTGGVKLLYDRVRKSPPQNVKNPDLHGDYRKYRIEQAASELSRKDVSILIQALQNDRVQFITQMFERTDLLID